MSSTISLPKGKFIVFEGPDGCGKTTQLHKLASLYDADKVATYRSPGGSPLAEAMRSTLKTADMSDHIRILGMLLSMASTSHELVLPALLAGKTVLMDRYVLSTLVYQGLVGGFGIDDINTMIDSAFRHSLLTPDAYIVLNASTACINSRILGRGNGKDRFESYDTLMKTHQAYKFADSLVRERIFYVDGEGSVDEVSERINSVLNAI